MLEGSCTAEVPAPVAPDDGPVLMAGRCECEHVVHFPDELEAGGSEWHGYGAVPAGEQRAEYVGPICDDCARTHMREYLR